MKTYRRETDNKEIHDFLDRNLAWVAAVYGEGFVEVSPTPPTVSDLIAAAISKIDIDADAIYGAVLGNRGPEYTDAEAAAQAYKDAGYTGTVPGDVQCWATAKGWTATQSAEDILATASAWRLAKYSIRSNRLTTKELVRVAVDAAGVETAMAGWGLFVTAIRGQLGI
jgi:hypothetical protein